MKGIRPSVGRRATLLFPMIFLAVLSVSATSFSQTVSLNFGRTELREVLRELKEQTGYMVTYSDSRIEGMRTSEPVHVSDMPLEQALDVVLEGMPVAHVVENRRVMIIPSEEAMPQQPASVLQNIAGTVRNESGEPVAGASVSIQGTQTGITTDARGEFRMRAPRGSVLEFTHVGYETRVATVGQAAHLDITLYEAVVETGEVIVTGIFERNKEGFTGSATTVTGEELLRLSPNNALKALSMIDPSFQMGTSNLSGSNPTAVPDFSLRGSTNIGSYELDDMVVLRGDVNARSNQPLFVLDGIIGVASTDIMDLDPEQIATITILKDAAATVIYGSDAANGVVVVETKKPVSGQLRVSYNGNYGLTWPDLSDYDLASAAEKLQIEKLAGYTTEVTSSDPTLVPNYYNEIEKNVLRGVDTDWLHYPVRTAFTHRHGLNFEGGDDKLRYKIHLGANFAPGVMKNTGLNGQSGRVDLHYRTGKISIINQTLLDFSVNHRTSDYGGFQTYALMNPYYTPYDENGNIQQILDPQTIALGQYTTPTLNPLYNTLYDMRDEYSELRVQQSLKVQYQPTRDLRLDLDFLISKMRGDRESFLPAHHTSFYAQTDPALKGRFTQGRTDDDLFNISLTGTYNKLLNGKHLLSAFARVEAKQNKYYMTSQSFTGFPNDKLSEVFMGATHESIYGSESTTRSVGAVFTGNYIYDQRYAADLSIRADAASQFGKDNRMAPFWSTGVRWSAHNEKFLEGSKWLSELVLRGSVGTTGSQDFNAWMALQTYGYEGTMTVYPSSDVVGATLLALGNPDLKWAQTFEKNVALDFTLWNGLLGGRAELYDKRTKNTLLAYTLPPSVGFDTVMENLGEVSNRGYELELRTMPWRNDEQRAYWLFTVRGAHNTSKIEKLSDAMKSMNDDIYASGNSDLTRPLPQYVEGVSQTAIWGVKSLGIDPQTGEEILLKRDGTTTTEWSAADRVVLGDAAPKLQGNVTTTLAWHDISLTVNMGYRFGGEIYNRTLADKVENANLRLNVDRRVLTERWAKPGDVAAFKGIDGSTSRARTNTTSRLVMRDDEFALQSVNISYRMLAADHKFLQRAGFKSAQVGLYMEDLLRFSTVRMERGINYPFARTISMSLNLAF